MPTCPSARRVNARKSFAAFKTVVEQYPKSEYAHDSLQRMVYLRNRLANYEVHVARYYYKRGAYVAAAQRAKSSLDQFDGAPATQEALQILISCYDQLHLTDLAAQSREVYAANYTAGEPGPSEKSPGGSSGKPPQRPCRLSGGSRW